MTTQHDNATVRAHYAALAARYDQGANKACIAAYEALARRCLAGSCEILEIGAGARPVSEVVPGARRTWTDLSREMLVAGQTRSAAGRPLVADAQGLPFPDGTFDAAISINVLEHVPDPARFAREAARVLRPGGRLLMVTPNGDLEWLLDLLERLHLKLPEGPHQFRRMAEVKTLFGDAFTLVEHREFLAFPAGPAGFVNAVDRLLGRGLFQYLLAERREQ